MRFTASDAPGSSIGLNTQLRNGKIVVSGVTAESPAEAAGVREADVILTLDGTPATAKALNDMLTSRSPGEKSRLKISRNNVNLDLEVTLGRNSVRKYEIQQLANPTALQAAIRRDWLRASQ